MGIKLIITESQEDLMLKTVIRENTYQIDPKKVLIVKKFLDSNFERASVPNVNGLSKGDSIMEYTPVVALKGTQGKDRKLYSDEQLYEMLNERFKDMFSDKIERAMFMKNVIKKWYSGGIDEYGMMGIPYITA